MCRPTAGRRVVAVLLLSLVAVAGCLGRDRAGAGRDGDLPPAAELLSAAAAELREVQNARFDITTSGAGEMLGVTGADGVVTRSGEARGRAWLSRDGGPAEAEFVVKADTVYVRSGSGGWREIPLSTAAAIYDPTALLDPDRGVARVLATARDARTEARESLDGAPAYRVRATFDTRSLHTLVPGLNEKITGTLWIDADRRLPRRIELPVRNGTGTITVGFPGFDEPVTIDAPR